MSFVRHVVGQNKQKLPFTFSSIKSVRYFELLHIDVWGPYKVPTHAGYRYFLTIVDDFSRATWVFFMKVKSETVSLLSILVSMFIHNFQYRSKGFVVIMEQSFLITIYEYIWQRRELCMKPHVPIHLNRMG